MPAYYVEFTTDRGTQQIPFTLDDDRPIAAQVTQIVEELRGRGLILTGGPFDELTVTWDGRTLDQQKSLAALRVTSQRSLILQMRKPAPKGPPPTPEPPITAFFARGTYLGPVAGLTGGLLAWFVTSLIEDLGGTINTYHRLDVVVAAILGATVGLFVLVSAAARRNESPLIAAFLGLLLGAVGAAGGAVAALALIDGLHAGNSFRSFALSRALTWGLTGAGLGLLLATRWIMSDRRRMLDASLYGMIGGAIAGLIYSLPGPSDLWQALAFILFGAAVGAGLLIPPLGRAWAVFALEASRERAVSLFGTKEWELEPGTNLQVAPALRVVFQPTRCTLTAVVGAPISVSGRAVSGSAELRNEDTVQLGERRYRFRRLRSVAG